MKKHRLWVGQLMCCVCGDNTSTEACHVRRSDASRNKFNAMGKKPKWPDGMDMVIPMCGRHHRLQHRIGERAFYQLFIFDPLLLAEKLRSCSGNTEKGEQVIRQYGGW